MANKTKIRFIYTAIMIVFFAISGMAALSYFNAKKTAETLVGPTLKYVQLNRVTLGVNPIGKKRLDWIFQFSRPPIMDAGFDVYVSVFGEVVLTNPISLEKMLRHMEKLPVHPYSDKGIKEYYEDGAKPNQAK